VVPEGVVTVRIVTGALPGSCTVVVVEDRTTCVTLHRTPPWLSAPIAGVGVQVGVCRDISAAAWSMACNPAHPLDETASAIMTMHFASDISASD